MTWRVPSSMVAIQLASLPATPPLQFAMCRPTMTSCSGSTPCNVSPSRGYLLLTLLHLRPCPGQASQAWRHPSHRPACAQFGIGQFGPTQHKQKLLQQRKRILARSASSIAQKPACRCCGCAMRAALVPRAHSLLAGGQLAMCWEFTLAYLIRNEQGVVLLE